MYFVCTQIFMYRVYLYRKSSPDSVTRCNATSSRRPNYFFNVGALGGLVELVVFLVLRRFFPGPENIVFLVQESITKQKLFQSYCFCSCFFVLIFCFCPLLEGLGAHL